MANFRLKLITPNNDKYFSLASGETRESFLTSIITDFNSQTMQFQHNKQVDYTQENSLHASYTSAFTYNEKLSEHKHGQKELTFQMDEKVFINNEWVENPYTHVLRNGVQLELTDKYNNCMLFTVQKVQYTFNNLNIIYNVTCQDSFTYQLTRQNEGYTLKNDETAVDYIGALDIDQWADKVAKECYVTYTYIPLDTGIYQDVNGGINTFAAPGDDIEEEPNIDSLGANVAKIIKPIYNKNKYADFYTTFPFSISGSNAAAALIALADQLGLQLNVVEGYDSTESTAGVIVYRRFFFFGPVKNPETTGLTYSPSKDVQAFNLSFSGDSLTTVLNVKSTTWEDEEIGLFPKIPTFISSAIMNETYWSQTEYYAGFFTDLVKGKVYTDPLILNTEAAFNFPLENTRAEEQEEQEEPTTDQYILIPFSHNSANFKQWPLLYNQIAFSADEEHGIEFRGRDLYNLQTHQMGVAITHNIDGVQLNELFVGSPSSQILMGTTWYDVTDVLVQGQHMILDLFQEETWEYTYENVTYQVFLEKMIENDTPKVFVGGYIKEQEGVYTAFDIGYKTWLTELTIDSDYFISSQTQLAFYPEYTDIPTDILQEWNEGKAQLYLYIKQAHLNNEQINLVDNACFIRPTRAYTQEEVDFAESAEKCPWLENKIIDFSYFHKIGIISYAEYTNLIRLMTNDLRIINGQLMCYATAYYESLHKQTKIIAELQAAVDKLGATFYSEVVSPYFTNGAVNANTNNFLDAYNKLFVTSNTTPTPLLNLNNLISDYFNKYFNANQRFLKNIYAFRKYFEAPNIYATHGEDTLEKVSYSVQATGDTSNLLISFNQNINWTHFNDSSNIIVFDGETANYTIAPLYSWKSDHYVQQKIPNPQNYKEFYIAEEQGNTCTPLTSQKAYNPHNTYLWKLDTDDSSFYETFGEKNWHKEDLVTINGEQYVKLKYSHIVKWFLKNHAHLWDFQNSTYRQPNQEYYIRDTQTKVPLEWVRCNEGTLRQAFNPLLWPGMEDLQKYLDTTFFQNADLSTNNELWDYAWPLYKAMMPIKNLYLKDYCLNYRSKEQDSSLLDWYVTDKDGNEYTPAPNNRWEHYDKDRGVRVRIPTASLYQKYFPIDILNYQGNLSSIFNSDNDIGITLHNLSAVSDFLTSWAKDANYYTKKTCFDWGTFWGDAALIAVGLAPFCALMPNPWSVQWTPAGATDYKLEVNPDANDLNQNGGWKAALGNQTAYRGDSYYINYVKSSDAEETIRKLTTSSSDMRQLLYGNDTTYSYNDYYKYVVFTYSTEAPIHSADRDLRDNYNLTTDTSRFYVQNKYATFCQKTTVLNPQDTYIWVNANIHNEDTGIDYTLIPTLPLFQYTPVVLSSNPDDYRVYWEHRFSAIKFYGLTEGKEELILSNFFTPQELDQKQTVESLVTKANWSFHPTNKNQIVIGDHHLYLIHLEPYEKGYIIDPDRVAEHEVLTAGYINPNRYAKSYKELTATDVVYHGDTDLPLTIEELTIEGDDHLFYIPEKDGQLRKVSDLIIAHQQDETPVDYWANRDNYHWYATPALESRTYTVSQILSEDSGLSYYYINNSTLNTSEVLRSNWEFTKNFTINLWTYELNADKTIIINDLVQNLPVTVTFNANQLSPSIEVHSVTGRNLTITITRNTQESIQIGNLSNGEFWYRFHNRLDIPDLLEKVIVIETELTNYWNQAYTASQYCEWFIPPTWTTESDKNTNYFANWIYHIAPDGHVKLGTSLLPKVEIYQYNKQTILPKLQFYYDFKDLKHLYHLSDIPHAVHNPAIAAALQQVWPDRNDRYVLLDAQEQGTTTYYYNNGGGLEWKNVLHFLKPTATIYDSLNGLYVMQLNILLNQYIQSSATLYEKTLNDKLIFWKNLYARFPGIFLEKTYENKDARSSQQLLQMAQLAFKDYTEPEKQYNITLIDAQALEGFQGQELKLGDAILLKPQDYYNDVDETYRALNQYLFISDISYTLRSDTDIALTVNIIKYQDKLLQSIVKLIR